MMLLSDSVLITIKLEYQEQLGAKAFFCASTCLFIFFCLAFANTQSLHVFCLPGFIFCPKCNATALVALAPMWTEAMHFVCANVLSMPCLPDSVYGGICSAHMWTLQMNTIQRSPCGVYFYVKD